MIKLNLALKETSLEEKIKELKEQVSLYCKASDVNELNRLENIKYANLKKLEDKKMSKFEQVINDYANKQNG